MINGLLTLHFVYCVLACFQLVLGDGKDLDFYHIFVSNSFV